MLAAITHGQIDGVIVWHLDRLHRQPRELEEFLDICDRAGIYDLACATGDIDLGTHDGRFHARILGAVARKSSDDASRRLRRKHEDLAEQGKLAGGGTRPFGYEDDRITVRPSEALLVKEAARRVLAGEGIRTICTDWTQRGIATVTGVPWKPTVLRNLLISPRIAGLRAYHGEVVTTAIWPPIVTQDDHQRLRALLTDPGRLKRHTARRYLLTGFARCGRCSAFLVARPNERKHPGYVCAKGPGYAGCGGLRVAGRELESFVVAQVAAVLETPELVESLAKPDIVDDAEIAELRSLEGKLGELAAAWARDEFTRSEWMVARAGIDDRIHNLRSRLASGQRAAITQSALARRGGRGWRWEELDFSQQRAVLEVLLEYVEIGPAVRGRNTFDPARVRIVWVA
jgi:DNA invertase Pin-like site-specific DNA recombinase